MPEVSCCRHCFLICSMQSCACREVDRFDMRSTSACNAMCMPRKMPCSTQSHSCQSFAPMTPAFHAHEHSILARQMGAVAATGRIGLLYNVMIDGDGRKRRKRRDTWRSPERGEFVTNKVRNRCLPFPEGCTRRLRITKPGGSSPLTPFSLRPAWWRIRSGLATVHDVRWISSKRWGRLCHTIGFSISRSESIGISDGVDKAMPADRSTFHLEIGVKARVFALLER